MPARVSESFVLRTYPFREADLVVSFFSRDLGKLRGIARRARRPKSAFGSGLERLSRVRMAYFQKENAELVSLTGCELVESQFALQSDYAVSMALDYFTEVTEQLMPSHEPNERYFRLLASVLAYLREAPETGEADRHARMWTAITYVSIWAVRLAGVWPDSRVSHEAVEIAHEMFVTPIAELKPREWTKATASDLRRLLVRTMEQHAERRFMTVPLLEAL
jgi:DNA repair protein RecO (recombination protein O)